MTKFLSDIILSVANDIQFQTTAGANAGKISQVGDDLVLSNAVGDILLGNGSDDIFIGDGTNTVDIRFEQNMAIFADSSSTRTLTLGGNNTNLVLESPTLNSATFGATTINNTLTFTTANGFAVFDYEPPGDTGEYTSEVPLLKVDKNGTPRTILSRTSENGAIMIGHDDTVALTAGDTRSMVKSNWGMTNEHVVFAAEGGYYAWGWPNNMQDDSGTTNGVDFSEWSDRYEFRFRTDAYSRGNSTTETSNYSKANNGLYIGSGGSTQFIDMNRNLKNIGTISSGAITTTAVTSSGHIKAQSGGNVYVYDDDDDTRIHGTLASNATEGVLKINNGANFGFIVRGITNNPRIGAYHAGNLNVYGFGNANGEDHADDDLLAQFDFGSEKFLVNGEVEATTLDINGDADISGTITSATWNGGVIASAYLDSDTAHLSGATFTGNIAAPRLTAAGTAFPQIFVEDTNSGGGSTRTMQIGMSGNSMYIKKSDATGQVLFRNSNNTDLMTIGMGDGGQVTVLNELEAGSLDINGNADISGATTTSGNITATANNATISAAESGGATTKIMGASVGRVGTSSNHNLEVLSNNTAAITIDTSQNSTFAGNITLSSNSNVVSARKFTARDANGVMLTADDASSGLTIADNGNATFSGELDVAGDTTITNGLHVHHDEGIEIGDTGNNSTARTTLTSFTGGGNSRMKIKGGNFVHSLRLETSKNDFQYADFNSSYNGSDTTLNLHKSNSDTTGTDATTTISTGTSTFAGQITATNLLVNGGSISNTNGVQLAYSSDYAVAQLNGVTGSFIDFSNSSTDYKGRIIYTNSNNKFKFYTNATQALEIDSSQNATFAGEVTATEYNLPSGGTLDWANGDARIVEGETNNYSLTFKTYDGANCTAALRLDGDNTATFTGSIAVSGTVDGVDIATRDGVLTSTTTTANAALPKTGGTMTGAITLPASNPTNANHATRKAYVDAQVLARKESFILACSDETNNLTASSGTPKVTFRMPYAFTLTDVRATVSEAPVGSTIIVDVKKGGTSIFQTKVSIDANAESSFEATTAKVFTAAASEVSFNEDEEVTIFLDQVGSSTAGKGLKVMLIGTQ